MICIKMNQTQQFLILIYFFYLKEKIKKYTSYSLNI